MGHHFERRQAGDERADLRSAGDHAGLKAGEFLVNAGAKVEIMTPDKSSERTSGSV
jgi:hypothetical protein